jgi:DNA-binding HxlR family transcriptional regulator
MRSYGQYCALAKALDVLGDRWTLLIVRELMLAGPSRYTDLRNGLPGIATNLLADRLRELEAAGVIAREQAPPPVATTLFSLTPRGEALRPVLDEIGNWGVPYMAEGPSAGDAFRGRWLAWPAERFLTDSDPQAPPVSIELRTPQTDGQAGEGGGDRPVVVETVDGAVRARPASPGERPDALLSGSPYAILGLLSGQIDVAEARRRGLSVEGDTSVLDRLRPAGAAAGE